MQSSVRSDPRYFGEEREYSFTSSFEDKTHSLLVFYLLKEKLAWDVMLLLKHCRYNLM